MQTRFALKIPSHTLYIDFLMLSPIKDVTYPIKPWTFLLYIVHTDILYYRDIHVMHLELGGFWSAISTGAQNHLIIPPTH